MVLVDSDSRLQNYLTASSLSLRSELLKELVNGDGARTSVDVITLQNKGNYESGSTWVS